MPWNWSSRDEQDELRDGVRAMLAARVPDVPRARGRRGRASGRRRSGSRWSQLGWPGAHRRRGARRARARRGRARGRGRGARPRRRTGPVRPDRVASSRPPSASSGPPTSRPASFARSPTARSPGRCALAEHGGQSRSRPRSTRPRRPTADGWSLDGRRSAACSAPTTSTRSWSSPALAGHERRRRRRRVRRAARRHRGRPGTRTRPDAQRSRPSSSTGSRSPPTACSASRVPGPRTALRRRQRKRRPGARARDRRHVPGDLRRHARVREAARAVRRADRLVPGDQAQVRRHAHRARAGPCHRLLRRAHDRRGRRPALTRRVGREGRGRRVPTAARQGGHPDPRRHRVHVGARHAPLRAPREDRRRSCSARRRTTAPASPTCSGSSDPRPRVSRTRISQTRVPDAR